MMPIAAPPFYGAPVWPVVSNTQGGPVHDARQRVVNVFGAPIQRLYAAGELGSAFGHLYMSGGNIAECFVSGRIAGAGRGGAGGVGLTGFPGVGAPRTRRPFSTDRRGVHE